MCRKCKKLFFVTFLAVSKKNQKSTFKHVRFGRSESRVKGVMFTITYFWIRPYLSICMLTDSVSCTLYYNWSTLNQNYSVHSYGFFVSTTTSLVVPILLLVIRTRLIVELTWTVKNSKITKVWKQYKHILILYNHTSILILLRLHYVFNAKKASKVVSTLVIVLITLGFFCNVTTTIVLVQCTVKKNWIDLLRF
jgi:hypothetical protein